VQSDDDGASLLAEWAIAAQVLAALRGACDAGVLAALRESRTVGELSELTGRSVGWVVAVCDVLEAYGVALAAGGRYELTRSYAAMLAPDAPQPLNDLLAGIAVRARHLETGARPDGSYTALSSSDRVAVARSLGNSPLSPEGRAMFVAWAASGSVVSDRWRDGADHLELGCGVGNALLSFAAAFPALRAVGVELDPALAAEARRRARALGLENRVRVRNIDARELDDEANFDTAAWSQLFFPAETRKMTLDRLHRALRPGGLIALPTLADRTPSAPPASSLKRLLIACWGVPVHTEATLRSELEDAGFQIVSVRSVPPRPLVLSESVVYARRP
jgi:SAM-dependent methyltransferase